MVFNSFIIIKLQLIVLNYSSPQVITFASVLNQKSDSLSAIAFKREKQNTYKLCGVAFIMSARNVTVCNRL